VVGWGAKAFEELLISAHVRYRVDWVGE